jgi:MFS family permease
MTLVAVLLMDRAGRRLLLLISLAGMCLSVAALAGFHTMSAAQAAKYNWLALAALVGYIVAFSLGLGAIPWLLMGEIFPSHVRALGASIATLLNWTFSFIVTETFDYVRLALGPAGTFFAFSGICAAGFVFVAMCVPETKGRSLEEVEALFS